MAVKATMLPGVPEATTLRAKSSDSTWEMVMWARKSEEKGSTKELQLLYLTLHGFLGRFDIDLGIYGELAGIALLW